VFRPATRFLFAVTVIVAAAACGQEASETATAQAPEAPEAPGAGEMSAQPHPIPTEATADVDLSGIARAEGGQTVAEIFAAREQLAGETVLIRGKVVKVNAGIMGKNWLHVRDGSGEEGSNDLTVTTTGVLPEIGDTVLVTGALGLNRDFGMNYKYPVIIEDAEVTVEDITE
jgi:hypothetical protein